jgi:hypothetical protein
MLSLDTARKLSDAGLTWRPARGDRFIVPDRGMDAQVFVINDMATTIETLRGWPAVTFHGTSEWALDYVWLAEVVWLPTEEQLRTALQERLVAASVVVYDLLYADGAYTCRFAWDDQALAFRAAEAVEAYAGAVLHLLQASQSLP